jgi:hypothetical protein
MIDLNLHECFFVAVFGYVVAGLLMRPGFLLYWHYNRLDKWVNGGSYFGRKAISSTYEPIKWRDWVSKPLGMCSLCSSGQIALWYGLSTIGEVWQLPFFVSMVIFIVHTIQTFESYAKR